MTLTPDELASRDALARKVDSGSMMAVTPVRQAEIGNRVLEATGELLHEHGFLVVVAHGGSDDAVRAAWSLIAAARIEAAKKSALRPTVLIVKDAHLLPPGGLDLLAQAGDLVIVAAPVTMHAPPQKTARLRHRRIVPILIVPILASLAAGMFLWPASQRDAAHDPAVVLLPSAETAAISGPPPDAPAPNPPASEPVAPEPGAPGLLVKAKPGDTLETLYQRVYRGHSPPPFASVAALNPEPVRPGVILTFPEPVNGWTVQDCASCQATKLQAPHTAK